MTLYVVRDEQVPVEQLRAGDTLILPSGRRVFVDHVDEYEDGTLVVRWWRRAEQGEPGHRGGKHHKDAIGADLGSLVPKRRGETVRVARG